MTPRPPANASTSLPRIVIFASLAFVLALLAYAPALDGPFVWDDQTLVLRKEIAELQPLGVYLSRPFWVSGDWEGGASYYRPLSILSLALDHALHGDNPTGFHLTNLVLHGLNAVLVFALTLRLRASPQAALLGALIFGWFPRLSEAAAWISGRTDVLATFFALAASLVTLTPRRGRTWLAAGLVLLGLFSKEVAIAAALSILVHEWRSSRERPLLRRFLQLAPTASCCLLYLVLRNRILGHSMNPGDVDARTRLLSALEALGRYGAMIVDGWEPQLNIGALGEVDSRFVALGVGFLVVLIPLCLRLKLRPDELLLASCSAIALGLVLHLVPFHSTVVVADRFLYLPIATLAPVLLARLASWEPVQARRRWLVASAALTVSYLPFTWQRARVWGDEISFWGTAVREQTPKLNALSHLGLGSLLAESGMWEEAMSAFNRAQPGDGRNFLLARHNQAQLVAMNGETERALAVLEQAARQYPMPTFYSTIAMLHTVAGREDQARAAVAEFARMVDDQERVSQLAEQVATASKARPSTLDPSAPLAERIERAQKLSKRLLFRVAMTELMALIDDPAMTSENLRGILVFALGYGTPAQVAKIHRRLLQLDPSTPEEFSLLVSERERKVERLRELCRQLGIEVRS